MSTIQQTLFFKSIEAFMQGMKFVRVGNRMLGPKRKEEWLEVAACALWDGGEYI